MKLPGMLASVAGAIAFACAFVACASETETPRHTESAVATRPSTPSETEPAQTQTAITPWSPLGMRLLLIKAVGEGVLYLQHMGIGDVRVVELEDGSPIWGFLGWAPDGCNLIVHASNTESGGRVLRVAPDGRILEELLNASLIGEARIVLRPLVSPDARWVAYAVASGRQVGEFYTEWEFYDIEVVASGSGDPVRLTSRGGAYSPGWSPDSSLLAYADYDEAGIRQVFVSTPIGEARRQVSAFADPSIRLYGLMWSPDGDHIVVQSQIPDPSGAWAPFGVTILSLRPDVPPIDIRDPLAETFPNGWIDSTRLLVSGVGSRSHELTHLTEYDVLTGVSRRLYEVERQAGSRIHLLGGRYLVFYEHTRAGTHFYAYDLITDRLSQGREILSVGDIAQWSIADRWSGDVTSCGD